MVLSFGKLLCFGDSIGQGQNNGNYSYIDALEETDLFTSVTKAAVGSATFGPYIGASNHPSLQYGVGSSFYEQARKSSYSIAVTQADNIIVQYFANDVLAILGNLISIGTPEDTGTTTICGMIKSTLDYIYNLNNDVVITWIGLFDSDKNIQYFANAYLGVSNNYNLGYSYNDIYNVAKKLNNAVKTIFTDYNCYILPIFEGKPYNNITSDGFFSSDNVHPNTSGQIAIAKQFIRLMFGGQEISWNEVRESVNDVKVKYFTMTLDDDSTTAGDTDIKISDLIKYYKDGYEVKGKFNFFGIDLVFNIASVFESSNYVTMSTNVMTSNSSGMYLFFTVEIYSNYRFSGVKAFNIAASNVSLASVISAIGLSE